MKDIIRIARQFKKIIIGVLILLFIFLFVILKQKPKHDDIPMIRVITATRQTLPINMVIPSTLTAYADVPIRSRVDGYIKRIHFKGGQLVKEGDLLIELDDELLQTQLRQANAALAKNMALLEQAEKGLVRNTELTKRDMASKATFDQAEATAKGLRASIQADQALIDSLNIQIGYTRIKSPLTGLVDFLKIDVGTFVRQGESSSIVSVRQVDPITVLFDVPERYAAILLKAKMESIKVELFYLLNNPIKGIAKITAFNSIVEGKSGTLTIKAEVDNKELTLRPGMSVTGRIEFGQHQNQIAIPVKTVQMGQKGSFVFVYDPNTQRVKIKIIKVLDTINEMVVVESGLSDGEQVVVDGKIRLLDGGKAKISDDSTSVKKNVSDDKHVKEANAIKEKSRS